MGRNKTITDEDVLAVARTVFQASGHAAPTRDIADAAGISQGVLFQRFGSKDELFCRSMTISLRCSALIHRRTRSRTSSRSVSDWRSSFAG